MFAQAVRPVAPPLSQNAQRIDCAVELPVRMTPVKSKGALRRVHVTLRRWEIGLRMRELHGDPAIWLLESKAPTDGSPWGHTRACPGAARQVGPGSAVEVVESEARMRVYAVHDYFVGLRAAMGARSPYSLYVMCRATIEACAFATWVFDPAARPEERLLRGLRLAREPLRRRLKSLEAMEADATGFWGDDFRSDIASARNQASVYQHNIERAIQSIHAEHQKADGHSSQEPSRVPSASQRVREMLCDEMDLPQGLDAYHRMSGIVHSEALAIIGTWNWDTKRPSIDYFSFLEFLHLALCAVVFMLERRAACWGENCKLKKLHRIIYRVEHIIEREPGVQTV